MAFDFERVIQATVDAVLENRNSDSQPDKDKGRSKRRGLTAPRAFLIGAGAVTAGRLVGGSRARDMLENVQQRLVEYEQNHFGGDDEDDYDEEPAAEDDEDFDEEDPEDDYDEEPAAEDDEDLDEEPAAEDDEDLQEEPAAEDDEDLDEEPADEDDEPEPPRRGRARSTSGSGGRRARR